MAPQAVVPELLGADDPPPYAVERADGASPMVFVADHAGRAIPRALGTLGLGKAELDRHIGWDIGIHGVTRALARRLDATYVHQRYSRLVIDCNRRPELPQSVPAASDGTSVPGNAALAPADVEARERAILRPYHEAIERVLGRRADAARPTALFAMHSCTERLRTDPRPRPWQISVLADRDWRLGDALVAVLKADTDLCVGVNEPYTVSVEADYTVPLHAERAGLPYAEIEIRQDLIGTPAEQRRWAALLATLFPKALARAGLGVP